MGLDFTGIHDQPGAAVYVIHDGTERSEANMVRLVEDIKGRTKKQVVLLGSAREKPASEVVRFYQLRGSEFVVIVRDDDQLHHVWSTGERFDASQIAYTADQAG